MTKATNKWTIRLGPTGDDEQTRIVWNGQDITPYIRSINVSCSHAGPTYVGLTFTDNEVELETETTP